MKYPLRFAIVGTGGIAAAYEAAFRTLTRARVTAVCDVRLSAAEAFAQRIGCDAFASPEYLARYGHFDAAVVCTPPATHESVATLLLEHGKHVLCEKPLATTVPSAWRMLEAARRNDSVLTMASKFRYVTDVRKAHDLAADGTVGDLIFVENAFTSRVDMRNRWNSDASVSGGGVLIDNGTHAVDILRYFLGNLRDVQIVEGLRIQGLAVEDTVRLFVHNERGVMGSSDLSWSIDKELESFLRVYGSEGTIVVGWSQSKYRRRDKSEWQIFGNGYDKVQAFCAQIENFCDALEGRCELVITARDALASVEVIRAAYAALERARWERVGTHYDEVDLSRVAEQETLEVS